MSENEEINRLNAHFQDLQNEISELKRVVSKGSNINLMINDNQQKQPKQSITSSKRGSSAFSQTDGTNKSLQNQFSDIFHANSSIQQDELQNINPALIQNYEQQKHQINSLKQNRNQLLEALEEVLQVISKDKQETSDSKQIGKLKKVIKQTKSTKNIFKTSVNQLRQEFLEIGHIEPLNLICKSDIEALNENSKRNKQNNIDIYQFENIKKYQPYIFNKMDNNQNNQQIMNQNSFKINDISNSKRDALKEIDKLKMKQANLDNSPNNNFNKLQQFQNEQNINKSPKLNQNIDNQNNNNNYNNNTKLYNKQQSKNTSIFKDVSHDNLNYSHTDMNSFYDNLNDTLNHTKQTILNTNKLNHMLKVSNNQQENNINLSQSKRGSLNQILGIENNNQNTFIYTKDDIKLWEQQPQQFSNYESEEQYYDEKQDNKSKQIIQKTISTSPYSRNNKQYSIENNKQYSIENNIQNKIQPFKQNQTNNNTSNSTISNFNNTYLQYEDIGMRQSIPIPLDMSQKTKDLKYKLAMNNNSDSQQQQQNNPYSINHNIRNNHQKIHNNNNNNINNNSHNGYINNNQNNNNNLSEQRRNSANQNENKKQQQEKDQYKLQQKQGSQSTNSLYIKQQPTKLQNSPHKYNDERSQKENNYNNKLLSNQLSARIQQQSQRKSENDQLLSNYHTFSKQDIHDSDNYHNY